MAVAPFFITDTQLGGVQAGSPASQSQAPALLRISTFRLAVSQGGRCWRSGHGQLDNLIKLFPRSVAVAQEWARHNERGAERGCRTTQAEITGSLPITGKPNRGAGWGGGGKHLSVSVDSGGGQASPRLTGDSGGAHYASPELSGAIDRYGGGGGPPGTDHYAARPGVCFAHRR